MFQYKGGVCTIEILTKNDLVNKLRQYADTPDDDVIRCKERIKTALLQCPELLYALNNKELESELFNEDGNLNASYDVDGNIVPEGEWDRYFGYNIRPYTFVEQVQESADNFLCYTVSFSETPKYNNSEYYLQIIFTVYCSTVDEQSVDVETGMARHDLIASILRERFAWSNIFGTRCKMVSNQEKITDSTFLTRQLVFELTLPNTQVTTPYNGKTEMINHRVRK